MPLTHTRICPVTHTIPYQVCLAERSIFSKEVLGIALQRILDLEPLPLLCMRTAMQARIDQAARRLIAGTCVDMTTWRPRDSSYARDTRISRTNNALITR